MKPKITPDEYRVILEALELDTLYLSELNSKFSEDNVNAQLSYEIDEKHSHIQENSTLKVFYTFKFTAKDDVKEESVITLNSKFTIRYNLVKDVTVTKDFMIIFSELTVSMLIWPYFRELLNSTVTKMGLPTLVLPLRKR